MRQISECIILESKARICREEEGKEICFQHPDYQIVCDVISIENCVFKNVQGGKRCDFLFLIDKNKQLYNHFKNRPSSAYYVELKGNAGLVEACKQLLNSIENTKDQIANFEINAIVVSPRKFIPKYDNNEWYRDIRRVIKKRVQFEVTPYTVNL